MNVFHLRVAQLALATSVLAFSTSAMADGYRAPPRTSGCCFSWTGLYVGANLGIASGDFSNTLSVTNGTPAYFDPAVIAGVNASGSQNLGSQTITGGVQIGYNVQSGGVVWGLELDFNSLRLKENGGGPFTYSTGTGGYILTEEASTNWLLTLRPRVGVAMDRGLAYITGGLAVASVHFNQFFSEPPFTPTPETASVSKTQFGWTLGAGYEHAFAHNWTFKAEYLFTRFDVDDAVGVLTIPNGRTATFVNNLDHLDIQTLRVGINYKFGNCCAQPLK